MTSSRCHRDRATTSTSATTASSADRSSPRSSRPRPSRRPTSPSSRSHVLFPREGDTSKRMRLRRHETAGRPHVRHDVDRRTQDGKVISAAIVSMHADEECTLHRSDAPPSVGRPDDADATDNVMMPFEIRVVDGVDLADRGVGPADDQMWLRARRGDEPPSHQALLAHATDLTIIGTALRPFEGVSQADSTVTLHTAVTSHIAVVPSAVRIERLAAACRSTSPVVANGRPSAAATCSTPRARSLRPSPRSR